MTNNGNIPVLLVRGNNLPEVWEKSVLACWERGIEIKTQYDRPGDPLSKDCTMTMVIEEPLSEPRIHRGFPGGLEDLEIYRQEVVDGIHDSWVDTSDPAKWDYTYHQRLMRYPVVCSVQYIGLHCDVFDQIHNYVIPELIKTPYSRRVQAVTWEAEFDTRISDPPCLQRIWCRILENKSDQYVLNMQTSWRSRDAFKAAFMNLFAMVALQEHIAKEVAKRLDKPVIVGQMVDISNSYHIYGKDFGDKEKPEPGTFFGFLRLLKDRNFDERTWTMEFAELIFQETREKLEREKLEKEKMKN